MDATRIKRNPLPSPLLAVQIDLDLSARTDSPPGGHPPDPPPAQDCAEQYPLCPGCCLPGDSSLTRRSAQPVIVPSAPLRQRR